MAWGAISYNSRSALLVIQHTLTVNLYVSLVIQSVVLPFMNNIQGGVFQQDNPHSAVVTWSEGETSESKLSGYGHKLVAGVSWARVLLPLKTRRVDEAIPPADVVVRKEVWQLSWYEKENGDCKTELAAGTMWNLKQEPALITDPISDVGKCI
ncbi:hypothetical protein TNCV_2711561 [Trichonephila clavipes]|nr:hypothetical protein TNCV_2711561 [Trichonephila clavipes]